MRCSQLLSPSYFCVCVMRVCVCVCVCVSSGVYAAPARRSPACTSLPFPPQGRRRLHGARRHSEMPGDRRSNKANDAGWVGCVCPHRGDPTGRQRMCRSRSGARGRHPFVLSPPRGGADWATTTMGTIDRLPPSPLYKRRAQRSNTTGVWARGRVSGTTNHKRRVRVCACVCAGCCRLVWRLQRR